MTVIPTRKKTNSICQSLFNCIKVYLVALPKPDRGVAAYFVRGPRFIVCKDDSYVRCTLRKCQL